MSKIWTSLPWEHSAGWRSAAMPVRRAAGLFNPQTHPSCVAWTGFQRVRPLLHKYVCLSCWLCCSRCVLSWSLCFTFLMRYCVLSAVQMLQNTNIYWNHLVLCLQSRFRWIWSSCVWLWRREPEDLTQVFDWETGYFRLLFCKVHVSCSLRQARV